MDENRKRDGKMESRGPIKRTSRWQEERGDERYGRVLQSHERQLDRK